MHAVSNWYANGSSGVELSSSCTVYASRKMLNCVGFSHFLCGNGGFSLVSFNLRVFRSGFCSENLKFGCGCGIRHGCSKLKVALLMKPKRNSIGAWFLSAWAVEQQTITDEFVEVELNAGETLPEGSDLIWDDQDNIKDDYAHEQVNLKGEQELEGEKGKTVDVRALAQRLRLATTAEDIESVLEDVGELPLQVYSSLIRGFGRDKRFDCAMALVEWLKRKKTETNGRVAPNLFIYNSLLGAVKQSAQFQKMEEIMADMAREGVVSNVVTLNTIMTIFLEQGLAMKALSILEEMPKKGLTPSSVSYSTALRAYRRLKDGNGALKFMIELKERYLHGEIAKDDDGEDWVDEFRKLENFTKRVCYQVMRHWLVKGDNASTKVLQLLIEMDKAGFPLARAEEERLIWACTCAEHHNVAKELYCRIRERNSDISLSVCNHVIWLMGKAKKWWAALEIYEDLLEKGPKPNNLSYELIVSHFNVLLSAAKRRGIWRWGVRLLNKMEEKGLKPRVREWNAVLIACSRAGETSAAVEIFRRMVEQGQKPTVLSYGALLSALEKGKLYEEARNVWDHMIKVGVEPNISAYTTMASVFAGQEKFHMVELTINEMVSSGIKPTVVTYNAIIASCAHNGMSSVAYEWFHRMKIQNISPNEVSYELLIGALAKEGKPRLASELYIRAQSEGLNLSSKTYDAVIQSSQAYGATIDTKALGPRQPDKNNNA